MKPQPLKRLLAWRLASPLPSFTGCCLLMRGGIVNFRTQKSDLDTLLDTIADTARRCG